MLSEEEKRLAEEFAKYSSTDFENATDKEIEDFYELAKARLTEQLKEFSENIKLRESIRKNMKKRKRQ